MKNQITLTERGKKIRNEIKRLNVLLETVEVRGAKYWKIIDKITEWSIEIENEIVKGE